MWRTQESPTTGTMGRKGWLVELDLELGLLALGVCLAADALDVDPLPPAPSLVDHAQGAVGVEDVGGAPRLQLEVNLAAANKRTMLTLFPLSESGATRELCYS